MSAENNMEKKGWLLPLVLLVGLIGLSIWFFNRNVEVLEKFPINDSLSTSLPLPVTPKPVNDTLRKTVVLPDGSHLPFSKGTMELKLVEFLNDKNSPAGKDLWFDFDDVNFDLNSAAITKASETQLSNIAAIFRQYPKLKAKVGGYTDKSGDENANMKLSQERADAVHQKLILLGVKPDQLEGAEGYGSQFAKSDANAPEDQRRQDRRMSLGIRQK